MKKLIFDSIITCFCALAAFAFAHCYALDGDRLWLAFSFMCLVCIGLYAIAIIASDSD